MCSHAAEPAKPSSRLVLSSHAQVVIASSGALGIYHSILGRPLFVTADVQKILHRFVPGAYPSDVAAEFALTEAEFRVLIAPFVESSVLSPEGCRERDSVDAYAVAFTRRLIADPRVQQFELIVSDDCNLACPHCIHRCALASDMMSSRRPRLMDAETAMAAIDACAEFQRYHGQTAFRIHFGSAEPLLNFGVLKQAVLYTKAQHADLQPSFSMNSNLTLLDEGMARFIRQNHIEVGTSLDGDGPAHDASRFDANGAGTYRLVLRAIELLLDVGCQPPGVNLTVTERNFEGLGAEAVRAFANQGLTELAVDIDQIHMLSRSTEALVDKILDLRDAGDDVGIPVAGIWRTAFQNLFADGGSADEQPVSFCRPSRGESLAIAPNGDVLMCPHSRDPVGHVSSLSDVFREDGVLARRVSQNLRGQRVACRGCEIEGLCMGQCMVTNDCSDPRKIEQMCAFYRTVTRCLTAEKINAEMHDALVTV